MTDIFNIIRKEIKNPKFVLQFSLITIASIIGLGMAIYEFLYFAKEIIGG